MIFTKRLVCPACRCVFTISSAASKYCQNHDCKNKRRREDYAAKRDKTGAYAARVTEGSAAHLARALRSAE